MYFIPQWVACCININIKYSVYLCDVTDTGHVLPRISFSSITEGKHSKRVWRRSVQPPVTFQLEINKYMRRMTVGKLMETTMMMVASVKLLPDINVKSCTIPGSIVSWFWWELRTDDQNKQVQSVKILKYRKIFLKISFSFSNSNKIQPGQGPTYLVITMHCEEKISNK